MTKFIDYYEVLQVHPKAEPEVIEKAYKALMLKHHPDQGGDTERAKAINLAYEVLRDPAKRSDYNIDWGVHQGSAGAAQATSSQPPAKRRSGAEPKQKASSKRSSDSDRTMEMLRRVEQTHRLLEMMQSDAARRRVVARGNPGAVGAGLVEGLMFGIGLRGVAKTAASSYKANVKNGVQRQQAEFVDSWWGRYSEIWVGFPDPPAEAWMTKSDLQKLLEGREVSWPPRRRSDGMPPCQSDLDAFWTTKTGLEMGMREFGITKVGDQYLWNGTRFDRLENAMGRARRRAADGWCQATTTSGKACGNRRAPGSKYCTRHTPK